MGGGWNALALLSAAIACGEGGEGLDESRPVLGIQVKGGGLARSPLFSSPPSCSMASSSPPCTCSMASSASRLMKCRELSAPLATGYAVLEMRAHRSSNRLPRSSLGGGGEDLNDPGWEGRTQTVQERHVPPHTRTHSHLQSQFANMSCTKPGWRQRSSTPSSAASCCSRVTALPARGGGGEGGRGGERYCRPREGVEGHSCVGGGEQQGWG